MKIQSTPLTPNSKPLLSGLTGQITTTYEWSTSKKEYLEEYLKSYVEMTQSYAEWAKGKRRRLKSNDDTPTVPRVNYLGRKSQVP